MRLEKRVSVEAKSAELITNAIVNILDPPASKMNRRFDPTIIAVSKGISSMLPETHPLEWALPFGVFKHLGERVGVDSAVGARHHRVERHLDQEESWSSGGDFGRL